MRENIAIVILLVATTLIYSLVMVNVYGSTVASEDTAGSSAVSEDTAPSGETAFSLLKRQLLRLRLLRL